ncbi:hypothetical protein GWE18_01480 [Bradyrhizobium sp. CSA112]|uniref:hypothetical protein n=1 Tax=Bradyrhizobium sp. CSA112 TaxID=2699170 RepID=UPI0023AF9755|nr:hypothetical protein [Bradyrhizobium sp. CSA112]MDE5451546.1 hypothetical protein [Bradyrhizobium sp. CSA112]
MAKKIRQESKEREQAIAIGLSGGRQGAKEAFGEILVRSGQIDGRIGDHPVVKQVIPEIIERAKPIALGIAGRQDLSVARECWLSCHRSSPLRRRPPVRGGMSIRTASE